MRRFQPAMHSRSSGSHDTVVADDVRIAEICITADHKCAGRKQNMGEGPLHAAARGGHADIVRLLLNKQAPLNWRNTAGQTALHVCCAAVNSNLEGRIKVAEALLSHKKLYIGQVDNEGRTAAAVARDPILRTMVQDALEVRGFSLRLFICA